MNASHIQRIAIVGAGAMGQGIAQDFATHDYEVSLCMYGPRKFSVVHVCV